MAKIMSEGMSRMAVVILAILWGLFVNGKLCADSLEIEEIVSSLKVNPTNATIFNTPIAVYRGSVYFVAIQDPHGGAKSNGYNLQTVVYKATRCKEKWTIEKKVLETRTIEDRWHTQASIGIDPDVYIHVAYNMHNMPWQYSVSERPGDISSFEFKGQLVSLGEIKKVKLGNETNFPTLGECSIPGNQITYPAFYNDNSGNLYVTYRFKLKPARQWKTRSSVGGIARYDHKLKKWIYVGGSVKIDPDDAVVDDDSILKVQHPFLSSENYEPYLIQLAFDSGNGMHASWLWRKNGAGRDCSNPCYVKVDDDLSLPISFGDSAYCLDKSDRKYYAPSSLAIDKHDNAWIVLSPMEGGRELRKINDQYIEKTPYSASQIIIDNEDDVWLFASGPHIFRRNYRAKSGWHWRSVFEATGAMYTKVYFDRESNAFILYMQSDSSHIKIS